jgi:dephospho-CoA kinase
LKIIGLTGGIASGKSTVASFFIKENIPVIDTDFVYKELSKPATVLYNEIVGRFSAAILDQQGRIDRKRLGAIVFNDALALHDLNTIAHPQVWQAVSIELDLLRKAGHNAVCIMVPLLFESGFDRHCDVTVSVSVTPEIQLARLMKRDSLSIVEATKRIASQMATSERNQRANYVIDNSGSIEQTLDRFQKIFQSIRSV